MDIPLDEVLYLDAIASSSTGAAADADSTPTFAVYEQDNDTAIVTGNFTKRTSLTGDYRCEITLSAANGFEVGKWYSVIGSATVGGVAAKGKLKTFRIIPAETLATGVGNYEFLASANSDAVNVKLGTPAVTIAADIAAIEAQTDDIGTAGAGLTAIPWNASWDAEVQSECADALTAYSPGVTVTSPVVESDEIEIVRGDDYYFADSRQLGFTFTGAPSITGATVYLKVKFGADVLSITGTVTSSTACYFELTSTNTLQAPGAYLFDVSAVLASSSHVVTLTRGTLKVLPDAR